MCGCGTAPSSVPVLVVLVSAHRVITGGRNMVAGNFVAEVAAVVEFSNAKSVGPSVGASDPKLFRASSWELVI